jgi:hypothetical protein
MNIQEIGLKPNDYLSHLTELKFFELITGLIENICMYKGIKYDDNTIAPMVATLYKITFNKLPNLTVNDIVVGFETMMYTEDVKKISVQLLHQRLQKISIQKSQIQDKKEQANYSKHIDNSYFGKAMSLRILHDKGGKILDKNGDTLKEVMEAARAGYCYYTGNPVHIKSPDESKID